MVLTVTHEPIDPGTAYNRLANKRAGSVVFHYAVVKAQKGEGGITSCIEYAATPEADAELAAIAADLLDSGQLEDLLLIRRVGCLGIGDIISLVAASSPNSTDAFAACQQGISRMKKMATIVKKEIFAAA
jgi:molybdopterin synthase catalytic subunit